MKKQLLNISLISILSSCLLAGGALAGSINCSGGMCTPGSIAGAYIAFDTSPNEYVSAGVTKTYALNLDTYAAMLWDINAKDTIKSAFLTVFLSDDGDLSPEQATFSWDGGILTWQTPSIFNPFGWLPTMNVLSALNTTHNLVFTVAGTSGDFYVRGFGVTGVYCNNPVPEPTTMMLFGVGVSGLAGIARRRKN